MFCNRSPARYQLAGYMYDHAIHVSRNFTRSIHVLFLRYLYRARCRLAGCMYTRLIHVFGNFPIPVSSNVAQHAFQYVQSTAVQYTVHITVHGTRAMHGDAHGTSCEPQLFFAAVPHCTSSESFPSTASAKQKRLTKYELEEQEEWNERASGTTRQAGRSGRHKR